MGRRLTRTLPLATKRAAADHEKIIEIAFLVAHDELTVQPEEITAKAPIDRVIQHVPNSQFPQ